MFHSWPHHGYGYGHKPPQNNSLVWLLMTSYSLFMLQAIILYQSSFMRFINPSVKTETVLFAKCAIIINNATGTFSSMYEYVLSLSSSRYCSMCSFQKQLHKLHIYSYKILTKIKNYNLTRFVSYDQIISKFFSCWS